MKILVLVLLLISLSGCAKPEPDIIYRTQVVEVPVPQVIEFQIPEDPVLPIDSLQEGDRHDTVAKAYRKSVNILRGLKDQLFNTLEGIKADMNLEDLDNLLEGKEKGEQ